MILIHGCIREESEQSEIICNLKEDLYRTLESGQPLHRETVISACDRLCLKVLEGEYDYILLPFLQSFEISRERFLTMAKLFSKESLEYKCQIELCDAECQIGDNLVRKVYPLGILLHIAAGNVDGLPAYSVIEGLLAGNINILKLPSSDSGLSVLLLSELVRLEPALADYIYVFDVPSTETETLKQLADYSDGVVVWGGDEAVAAARSLADLTTKIISWGHKLSFAYVSGEASEEELKALARHICETNQVLCSSCQGIYLDTDSEEEQVRFAQRFFEILKEANREAGPADLGMRAKNAIQIYNERLEKHRTGRTILSGEGVSVLCSETPELELSFLFRNVWVKRLPREEILRTLKPCKNHLQTAGLLCPEKERYLEIAGLLAKAGVVRISRAGNMSRTVSGEAHDGTYPLREYSRIVETER